MLQTFAARHRRRTGRDWSGVPSRASPQSWRVLREVVLLGRIERSEEPVRVLMPVALSQPCSNAAYPAFTRHRPWGGRHHPWHPAVNRMSSVRDARWKSAIGELCWPDVTHGGIATRSQQLRAW